MHVIESAEFGLFSPDGVEHHVAVRLGHEARVADGRVMTFGILLEAPVHQPFLFSRREDRKSVV